MVFVIAALSFAFGFGNGWQLGLSLGVAGWIAPLIAPAVDLSVIALLATVQYLRALGVGDRLTGPRLLLVALWTHYLRAEYRPSHSDGTRGTGLFRCGCATAAYWVERSRAATLGPATQRRPGRGSHFGGRSRRCRSRQANAVDIAAGAYRTGAAPECCSPAAHRQANYEGSFAGFLARIECRSR